METRLTSRRREREIKIAQRAVERVKLYRVHDLGISVWLAAWEMTWLVAAWADRLAAFRDTTTGQIIDEAIYRWKMVPKTLNQYINFTLNSETPPMERAA